MFLIVYYLIVSALAAKCTQDTNTANCATDKCDVTIGGKTYCSQCKANYVPIDGTCTAADQDAKCTANSAQGICSQCKAGYFLHKGGCYQFGGEVGKLICTDPSTPSSTNTAGVCATCNAATGYFKNPANLATSDSCISCGDTKGVIVNGATYKGVDKCATCTAPQAGGSGDKPATCTACVDGYFTNTDGTTCAECTSPCKTCKGANNKCTSCNEGNTPYFKEGDANDGTGACVAEGGCGNTHFPVAADKKCYPCSNTDKGGIADCQECSKADTTVTCTTCTSNKKPNKAGTQCFNCQVAHCSHCSANGVCEACDGKKVSPGGSSCVTNCPDNSTEKETSTCLCNEGYSPKDGN